MGRTFCVHKLFYMSKQKNIFCAQHVHNMFWACNFHVLNLLSYCGLVDAKIRASDKDLPVLNAKGCVTKTYLVPLQWNLLNTIIRMFSQHRDVVRFSNLRVLMVHNRLSLSIWIGCFYPSLSLLYRKVDMESIHKMEAHSPKLKIELPKWLWTGWVEPSSYEKRNMYIQFWNIYRIQNNL